MNFSVHMDELTLSELNRLAKEEGKSRSALLSEAFRRYLDEHARRLETNGWPQVARIWPHAMLFCTKSNLDWRLMPPLLVS